MALPGSRIVEVYIHAQSPFHSLTPLTKVVWLLTMYIVALLFLDFRVLIPALASILIIMFFLINAPRKKLTDFLKLISLPFSFYSIGYVLFTREGNILAYVDWPWYHWFWITDWGFILSGLVLMRALILTLSTAVVLFTTNMEGILKGLEIFGIKPKFGSTLTITIALLPTMLSVILSILEAQKARGFGWEKLSIIKKARGLVKLLLPTMFSAIRYATLIPLTMESRAFGAYKGRTYIDDYTLRTKDHAVIVICIATLVITVILGYGFKLLLTLF